MSVLRHDVVFDSSNGSCHAWLYCPEVTGDEKRPCIIMAHGFGGTKDAGLEPYAKKFSDNGFYVLLFDYRHFGKSDGAPRQLFSIKRQLEDWSSAIGFARQKPQINPDKIALWGTSFSGGHVLVTAAKDGHIAAISAQAPMVDALACTKQFIKKAGLFNFVISGALGTLDIARATFGMSPVYVPVAGTVQEHAALCSADALSGYMSIAPDNWRNEICARYALSISSYRPLAYAKQLQCPVLLQVCMKDSLVPPASVLEAATRIGEKAEVIKYSCGHFDIYTGEYYEQTSNDQLDFFDRILS